MMWIARNKKGRLTDTIGIWNSVPDSTNGEFFGDYLHHFKVVAFKKMFGYTPRKGSIKEFKRFAMIGR